MDLSGMLGYKPEMMEENETSGGFKALNGKYQAIVKNFERFKKEGVTGSGYEWCIDKIQFDFQIKGTVSGDKGDNRYVRKEFDISNPEYIEDSFKRILSMAMTITGEEPAYKYEDGDDKEKTVVKIVTALDPIIGKLCNLTVYPAKHRKDWEDKKGNKYKKGEIKKNYKGDEEMVVLVIKEHKINGSKTESKKNEVINSEDF